MQTQYARILTRGCYLIGTLLLLLTAWNIVPRALQRSSASMLSFARTPSRYTMVAVVRATDCISYAPMIAALNNLSERGNIAVKGIVIEGDEASATTEAVEELGIEFGIIPDAEKSARAAMARLGYRNPPSVLVIDPAGRLLMVLPPHPLPWRQADAVLAAAEYVNLQPELGTTP
jgi:hypothetical protein